MSKVYCQNSLCQYFKPIETVRNYGLCRRNIVYLTLQTDDEYEVTGHNTECLYSKQERKYDEQGR